MTIIDGMQRLTAIYQFMDHQSRLHGLQYLYEYQGYLCEELPSSPLYQFPAFPTGSQLQYLSLIHI